MNSDEPYEQTLMSWPEVFCYKLPPRATARGYKSVFGRLRVISFGDALEIKLEDPGTGKLFARCPIDPEKPDAVESVLDSSRYFVLRLDDGKGHHAFIGLGFQERSGAFDFNVAIQDHCKWVKQRHDAPARVDVPAQDFSLKEGQLLHIKVPAGRKKREAGETGAGVGVFALAPPPPAGGGRRGAGRRQQAPPPKQDGGDWVGFE